MPAKSKAQQQMMAIALHDPQKLYKRNRGVLSMDRSDMRHFAETKTSKMQQGMKRAMGRRT